MTLIAFVADGDSADILTDSASYTPSGRYLQHTSKVMDLHHLDTSVATQGDIALGDLWKWRLRAASQSTPDFDALVDAAPAGLREVWQHAEQDPHRTGKLSDSAAFLVGYSPIREAFTAYGFASDSDFEPWLVDGLHVMPSPLSMRPSELELTRMQQVLTPREIQLLRDRPQPQPPADEDDWLALALMARDQRACLAMESGIKVLVAGRVFLTHMERGLCQTTEVHEFDDGGEEFRRVVAGTHHPQGQMGPCPCGSGQRFLDCCLAGHLDEPCLCLSGKPFRECCRVDVATEVPA